MDLLDTGTKVRKSALEGPDVAEGQDISYRWIRNLQSDLSDFEREFQLTAVMMVGALEALPEAW